MKTKWKFETEDKEYSFFIFTENRDYDEAYNIAYESYGPQVKDMYYSEVKPDEQMYDLVLAEFTKYMKIELRANYLKGDRNGTDGWLEVKDKKFWISELFYHVGKLQSALMADDTERIKENCADIANIALMTLDVKIDLLNQTTN